MRQREELIAAEVRQERLVAHRNAESKVAEIGSAFAVQGLSRSSPLVKALLDDHLQAVDGVLRRRIEADRALESGSTDIAKWDQVAREALTGLVEEEFSWVESQLKPTAESMGFLPFFDSEISRRRQELLTYFLGELDLIARKATLDSAKGRFFDRWEPSRDEVAALTVKLFNRNVGDRDLGRCVALASRRALLLSLVLLDLDDFKQINDTKGHPVGDQVLLGVSECLRSCANEKGCAYRWGGEEFAIILPNFTSEEALALAERVRSCIGSRHFEGVGQPVTVSVGVSTFPEPAANEKELVEQADQALYESKKAGKNRTTVSAPACDHRATASKGRSNVAEKERC